VRDPERLNDQTTYQRCFACGAKNDSGLRMVFRREGRRIGSELTADERHQGFPGVVHGGILATLLDETLSRTGALRRQWLVTGKLDLRFRSPAPLQTPLRVWAEITRERPGAIEAKGAVELQDGTVVADGRGMFLRTPEAVSGESLARYPEFARYWEP
jgi:acyl-coenzyme A thioesterase PaaI-like protein